MRPLSHRRMNGPGKKSTVTLGSAPPLEQAAELESIFSIGPAVSLCRRVFFMKAEPGRPGAEWRVGLVQRPVFLFLLLSGLALLLHAGAAAGQPLVFLGDRDLAPYEFMENGRPRGANVDLALAIGRVLGRPVEVRLHDWTEAQSLFLAGQGNALTMLGRTPDREGQFGFSQATMPVSLALFVRADEAASFAGEHLQGRRVGVTRAGLSRHYLQARHPDATLVLVDSLADGTQRLVRREIDAFAAQEWGQYHLLSELGIVGITGLPAFHSRQGNIAFRKSDAALATGVDRALSTLKESGEFDRIIDRWSYTQVQLVLQSTVTAVGIAAGIALVALLLLSGTLLMVYRQRGTLREKQKQLEIADRHKDEFLATLAHELRNPLAPISNAVHILQLQGDALPQAQRARGIIARQVLHLTRLVDDLLDISRINTGKLELRKAVIELHAVIDDAVEASRPAIDQGRHSLVLQRHEGPVWLDADRVRLAQIVTNLLTNAAKYMAAGGRIELSTSADETHAMVRVQDTGVGISADRLGRIFDMFYQEERSLSRSQGGLGLGLWLTRQLVAMHGGTIEAASDGQGRGSRFTVRLPRAPAPAPVAAPLPVAGSAGGAHRILVIDDNRDGAETLALLLQQAGHQVEVAFDGAQGLGLGQASRPDLVFLDIGMPVMDGLEVCRRLRATDWGRAATVVALTGWGAEADKTAARQAGFDTHLTKPANAEALAGLLAQPPRVDEKAAAGSGR